MFFINLKINRGRARYRVDDRPGVWGRNLWREMKAIFRATNLMACMRSLAALLKSAAGAVMPADLGMLLPRLLFAMMYRDFRSAFNERILGGDGSKIGQFWRAMHAHPSYRVRPMHYHPSGDHMRRAVPIGLHFDAVVTIGSGKSSKRMIEAASWSSCLCQRGSS